MRYEHLDLAIFELDRLGLKYSWSYTNGNHIKLTVFKNGNSRSTFVSKTPSDKKRIAKNILQQIKRVINELEV